jgi:hypothetical protein
MTVLLVLGLIALFYGLARQANRVTRDLPSEQPRAGTSYAVTLGEADAVQTLFVDRTTLVLKLQKRDTEEIRTYDLGTGKELGRFVSSSQKAGGAER